MHGTSTGELNFLEDAVNQAYFNSFLLNILLLGMFLEYLTINRVPMDIIFRNVYHRLWWHSVYLL